MEILTAGWVGLLGTCLIAKEKKEELSRRFPAHLFTKIEGFKDLVLDKDLAEEAKRLGVKEVLSVSQGGILKSLWDMGVALDCGIEVFLKNIPILQETIEITEFYDINPYRLYSENCMIFAGEKEAIKKIQRALTARDIENTIIGRCTNSKDRVVFYDENVLYLTKNTPDEIQKVLEIRPWTEKKS